MPAHTSPSHLLAIDDSAELRAIYHDLFSDAGFHVALARPPVSLEEVRLIAPDLVLMDWPFPRDESATLISALRCEPSTAHLPVIVATTAPELVTADLVQDRGVRLVIKPFSLEQVLSIAGELLVHSRELTQRSHALRARVHSARGRLRVGSHGRTST